jgi:hypothetical protein
VNTQRTKGNESERAMNVSGKFDYCGLIQSIDIFYNRVGDSLHFVCVHGLSVNDAIFRFHPTHLFIQN